MVNKKKTKAAIFRNLKEKKIKLGRQIHQSVPSITGIVHKTGSDCCIPGRYRYTKKTDLIFPDMSLSFEILPK
jgi:hypothetical protein